MIVLRPFKKCDAAAVASWILNEREFYQWSAGSVGDYPATEKSLQDYSESIADDPNCIQMVAMNDDTLFGHMIMKINSENKERVHLGLIVVNPEVRGDGLGKKLVRIAANYAFTYLGARKVTLRVYEENTYAHKTYLSVGFSDTSDRKPYLYKNEHWTSILMELLSEKDLFEDGQADEAEDAVVGEIIRKNGFVYAFQPIVDAKTGEIYGYEALMRAEHDGTPISPLRILEYATKHDMLYDVEKMTMFNVLSSHIFDCEEFSGRKVFVNSIPGYQLSTKDYNELCDKYKKNFKNVTVEVTEHTKFKANELKVLLERSEQDCFELAIDDYGTGYSNTSNLLEYLPNYLKIDRLLIAEIHEDSKKQHFVKSIVEFAHNNGFKALAEGVETSSELKMVINLGVDLIQGFYTARPSFEVISEINPEIRNEIINTNVSSQTVETRKIYTVTDEKELPLMRIALEQNSGILISGEEVTLFGNPRYCAEMSIKIKDGSKTKLTIRDVFLESFHSMPCIELGQNVDLTLVVEGENFFRRVGIFVPESSRLTVEGDGVLTLKVQGVNAYAIGNNYDSGFGEILINGNAKLDILVEADCGVGIGGGYTNSPKGIEILSGNIRIEPASRKSIGIGAFSGNTPIYIKETELSLDLKTENGIGIGNEGNSQNTLIEDSKIDIVAAGTTISAIGSTNATEGNIRIKNSSISVMGNGQSMYLLGCPDGALTYNIEDSILNIKGEGNEITAIGSKEMNGIIKAKDSTIDIRIASGKPHALGAADKDIAIVNCTKNVSLNE